MIYDEKRFREAAVKMLLTVPARDVTEILGMLNSSVDEAERLRSKLNHNTYCMDRNAVERDAASAERDRLAQRLGEVEAKLTHAQAVAREVMPPNDYIPVIDEAYEIAQANAPRNFNAPNDPPELVFREGFRAGWKAARERIRALFSNAPIRAAAPTVEQWEAITGSKVITNEESFAWESGQEHLLAAMRTHEARCKDPEVCIDDKGPANTWRGCTENARAALPLFATIDGTGNLTTSDGIALPAGCYATDPQKNAETGEFFRYVCTHARPGIPTKITAIIHGLPPNIRWEMCKDQ